MNLDNLPQFLDYETIQIEVSQTTFMPGWELSTFLDPFEGPVFRVTAWVENSYDPTADRVQLRINSRIPWMTSVEQLHLWILWRLDQAMRHETREWTKVRGTMLFDPHDPAEPASER